MKKIQLTPVATHQFRQRFPQPGLRDPTKQRLGTVSYETICAMIETVSSFLQGPFYGAHGCLGGLYDMHNNLSL